MNSLFRQYQSIALTCTLQVERPAYQLGHRLRGVIRKFDRQPPFAQGWRRGFYLPAGRLLIDGTQHILQALVLETDVAGVAVKELRILRLADEQDLIYQ